MAEIFRASALIVLLGVLAMLVICRGLMLWQKQFTWRALWFTLMFAAMFTLLASASLGASPFVRSIAYVVLIAILSICTVYDWHDFFIFMREKNKALDDKNPSIATLQDLGDSQRTPGPSVALQGTEKPEEVTADG